MIKNACSALQTLMYNAPPQTVGQACGDGALNHICAAMQANPAVTGMQKEAVGAIATLTFGFNPHAEACKEMAVAAGAIERIVAVMDRFGSAASSQYRPLLTVCHNALSSITRGDSIEARERRNRVQAAGARLVNGQWCVEGQWATA